MTLLIVNSGQDGCEIGALKTSTRFGVDTKGYMPLGWVSMSGEHPEYENLYNLKQWGNTAGYRGAVKANTTTSEATIIIWAKPETIACEAVVEYNKPFLGVRLEREDDEEFRRHGQAIADFITAKGLKKVNITGNSSQTHPSAFKSTCWVMKYALEALGYKAT